MDPAPPDGARSLNARQSALGDLVKRSFPASVVLAIALLATAIPAALAAGPGGLDEAPPADPAPTPTPVPTDGRIAPDGEISVDPTFITEDPTNSPDGAVLSASGRPRVTPPPTDVDAAPTTSGSSMHLLLLLLAGAAALSLALTPRRACSRRQT